MRFRLFTSFLVIFAITFFQPAHAQDVIVKRSTVVENYKGKPCYIHFVSKGETLTAIAKAYLVTIEELSSENPAVTEGLKADMVLRIPIKSVVGIPEVVVPKAETKAEQTKPAEKPKEQAKPAGEQNYSIYQVKKQETLYGIAKLYNVSIDDIVNANPGFDGLKDGMEIRIPQKSSIDKPVTSEVSQTKAIKPDTIPVEIIVKAGETLYSISKTYNTTIDNLISLNPQLSDGLKAGMVVRLRNPDTKNAIIIKENENLTVTAKPILPTDCFNPDNIKNTYNVALILPFLLSNASAVLEAPEQKSPSEFESFNYFQFYAGFMLAADSLEKYGLKARIQVFDGDKLNDTLTIRQTLRKPGLDKMTLIVGPVYANSFAVAARFAKKNEIGIVNPLSRRENVVEGNPFVIKTQVSVDGIAAKLSAFILNQYPDANIIVVKNDTKEHKSLVADFSSQIKNKIANHTFKGTVQDVTYSTEMMAGVKKKLKANSKNVIIFFSNNKSTVPNFVSLLNPLAKSNDILLIGMDGWEELELETEFLVNLNFHQVTSGYIDYESEAVKQFITRFRAKYGTVPLVSKHAFLGYDTGWFFLTSLMWYGEKYIACLPGYKGTGLQFNFDFSGLEPGNGLQNKDVSIVKLQDYKMIKAE